MYESEEHVALAELFRCHPRLAVSLVVRHGLVRLPTGWNCRVVDPVYRGARRTTDVTILVEDARGRPLTVIVVEIQLRREQHKRRRFASYLWLSQDRWDCDGVVLVVSPSRAVATWARQPVLAGGSVTQILAVGPDEVPRSSDEVVACADPPLAVLSAALHGGGPAGARGGGRAAAVDESGPRCSRGRARGLRRARLLQFFSSASCPRRAGRSRGGGRPGCRR